MSSFLVDDLVFNSRYLFHYEVAIEFNRDELSSDTNHCELIIDGEKSFVNHGLFIIPENTGFIVIKGRYNGYVKMYKQTADKVKSL